MVLSAGKILQTERKEEGEKGRDRDREKRVSI